MALKDVTARESALIDLIREARASVDGVAAQDFFIGQQKYKVLVQFKNFEDGDLESASINVRKE